MSSEQLTADDLLSLCARAHGATGRLTGSPASPRQQTLRKLAGFVNDRMTAAALAHEREAVSIEVVHGLQDAVQALVFADLLSQIGVDAGGYIRLDRDGLRPAIAPTPAERGLHAGFVEQVDGVAAALFVVADELLEVAYAVRDNARSGDGAALGAGRRPGRADAGRLLHSAPAPGGRRRGSRRA